MSWRRHGRTDRSPASPRRDHSDEPSERLRETYEALLPRLYWLCRARLDSQDAEDVCAEVFRQGLERMTEDPTVELGEGWFVTAARSRIIDRYRRAQRWEPRLRLVADSLPTAVEEPDEDRRELLEALDELPPLQRGAAVLHYVEGYSAEEIGELLDRSPTAVHSLLARARRALREALQPVVALEVGP